MDREQLLIGVFIVGLALTIAINELTSWGMFAFAAWALMLWRLLPNHRG